jgi:homoserine O-acetyltransferase
MSVTLRLSVLAVTVLASLAVGAADYPAAVEREHVLQDFRFADGAALAGLTLHYRTLGTPRRDARGKVDNAVLILHGTGGNGANFLKQRDGSDSFAAELFGAGQPLDAARWYIVLPDAIGHGRSAKPSDGLRARFPRYGYRDMVAAQHRLLVEALDVEHLRLVIGTSMGGMHAWLWGVTYPDFADGLVPLASLPAQISGRNRMWRRIVMDAIRNDPAWRGGDYERQPPGLTTAAQVLLYVSGTPLMRQAAGPTLAAADRFMDQATAGMLSGLDANDLLYAVDASHDYDPGPRLETIRAPVLAINFADDLVNPPELGILEREIRRVPRGEAVLIPAGPDTVGHGTHTRAAVWRPYLERFLRQLD